MGVVEFLESKWLWGVIATILIFYLRRHYNKLDKRKELETLEKKEFAKEVVTEMKGMNKKLDQMNTNQVLSNKTLEDHSKHHDNHYKKHEDHEKRISKLEGTQK